MAKIVGPDPLNRGTEIVFNLAAKTIQLVATGNLLDTSPATESGVTLQAVYSKCKELWKDETDLNKFRFPFDAITEAKMDFINGWDWADQTTRELVRDGGWSVRDGAGVSQQEYMGVISLGTFPVADRAYYQQEAGFDAATTPMVFTGVINEPVQLFDSGEFDFRDFFKLFLRVQGRTYAVSDLIKDQGFTTLDYTVFRLPLSSIADINIVNTDAEVDSEAPYVGAAEKSGDDGSVTGGGTTFTSATDVAFAAGDVGKLITILAGPNAGRYEIVSFTDADNVEVNRAFPETEATITFQVRPKGMTIDYLDGARYETWVASTAYVVGDVVLDPTPSPSRWFRAVTNHSGETTNPAADATNWEAYPGELQIGDDFFAFNRLIDANGGSAQQIYTFAQRMLRIPGDINDDPDAPGVINGDIAVDLAGMVGSTLVTNPGAAVQNFDVDDQVNMQFRDITVDGGGLDDEGVPLESTSREFPFVSSGTIVPNSILVDDAVSEFTMYFTTNPAGNFDTVDAVIVEDADGVPISGAITGNIPFTFDYDANNQGGRTPGTDAGVTIVAIGLETAQYVTATFTITRSVGLVFPINAVLERNYVAGG